MAYIWFCIQKNGHNELRRVILASILDLASRVNVLYNDPFSAPCPSPFGHSRAKRVAGLMFLKKLIVILCVISVDIDMWKLLIQFMVLFGWKQTWLSCFVCVNLMWRSVLYLYCYCLFQCNICYIQYIMGNSGITDTVTRPSYVWFVHAWYVTVMHTIYNINLTIYIGSMRLITYYSDT